MGDAQSAQREDKKDAEVEDAPSTEEALHKPFKTNGEISELSGKADGCAADVSGHCEDELAAEAVHSQDKDVSRTESLPTELENVEFNETQIPETNEKEPMEIIDMEVKQNDINESFRRFFSNIGLKLTVKRGSIDTDEIATNVPDETKKEEANRPEDETANETKSEDIEQNSDVNKVQETFDNDSTTCPTLTDGTSDDVLENLEEKLIETKDQALSEETEMNLPLVEHAKVTVDDAPKEEPEPSSPSNPHEEVVSPIKKFFTTGIFSSLRKKKPAEDETADKELVDMGKKKSVDETGQTVQDQQEQTEETTPDVDAQELKDDIQSPESAQTTDSSEIQSASADQSKITVNEPEILTSQEKDKVQASPLKRLLSGSSFTRRSKKQKSRRSSDAKLSDSGEHSEDHLLSSTEPTDSPVKEKESPIPPLYAEGPVEEEGAWASFKKLMTPKKRMKQPPLSNEETQIPAAGDELKPGDQEQISDHSTEEGRKRKDSSVSWEAVLCGSGRRRSRKTSDSEDEMPQDDKVKEDGETHSVKPHVERANEVDDITASSPKQAGSPSENDGGSTWKSFKKFVTPKRKAKDEEEGRDNIQPDSEVTQEDSSFSIKKLLPGRKKRKPAEKSDQVSSDEADKEATSGDEDSETPAVVPLSEFDSPEAEGPIQTQADIESIPQVLDHVPQQDQLCEMTEHLQTSLNEVQDSNQVLVNQTSTIPALHEPEEPDDLTELISKHQQLSDIPEEGLITDTMATPASAAEEAARDDTIAEDFIEITSEAITAPEPVDSTQADETEMISAVSQLSDSSKTSGNTTPVPAEFDMKETEVLLQQVVETISETPDAFMVCSEDLYPERIAGSVSHQIFETITKQEQTILKLHRQSDATAIRTGLKVSTLDEVDEIAASAQTECISELIEAISTEITSEVSTEEFDSAQLAEDEVHKVNISHPHESIKQFEQVESKDDNRFQLQSQSGENESVSTEILQTGEDIPDEASLCGVHQLEEEPSKMYTQDQALSAAGDETAALVIEQEVESLIEIKDEIIHDSTAEFIEPKEQLAKADEEPENQAEQQADAAKTESIQNSEMLESELSTTSGEACVQSTQKEHTKITVNEADKEPKSDAIQIDEIPAQEEGTFQLLEKEITKDDAAKEPEHKPPTDTVETDYDQVTEVLDLGVGTVQVLEKEIKDGAAAETDKPQEKTELFPEMTEDLEIVQKSTSDSGEGNVLSPEEKVKSEDHSQAEIDKFKQETDYGQQNKDEQLMNASQSEHVQEAEILDVQAAALNSGFILEDTAAPDVDESTEETKTSGELEEPPLENTKTEHDENKVGTETETQKSTEVVVQPDQALENENPKTGKTTDDVLSVQVAQEDHNSEDVDKIQPITAVHISSVNEDMSTAQILEKTVITEETQAPCVDKTVAVDEPEHEIHLSEVQVGVKEEKEGNLPHTETRTAEMECATVPEVIAFNLKDVMAAIPDLVIKKSSIESGNIEILEVTPVPCEDNIVAQDEPKHKTSVSEVQVSTEKEKEQQLLGIELGTTQVQHAVMAEVITSNLKEVKSAISDVFIGQISEAHEPMICSETNEQEDRETVEIAPLLVEDKVTETVQEGNTAVTMHMPLVEFEDNHSIQVQIVHVDIRSTETSVDTIKAGVTQTKEIVDVCYETVTKVDNLSATFKIKEEIISEEDKVTIQEVLQHVKESLAEPKPVSEEGLDVKEEPNDSIQQSDMVERKLREEEDQKMEEDTTGPDVTNDNSEAKQEIKHDLPEPKPVSEEEQEGKEEPNDSIQQIDMVERKLREEEDQKMEEEEEEEHMTGPDVTNDNSEAIQEIKHDLPEPKPVSEEGQEGPNDSIQQIDMVERKLREEEDQKIEEEEQEHMTGPDVTNDNSEAIQEIKHDLPEPKPVYEEGQEGKEEPNDLIQQIDMVERKLREEEDQKVEEEEEEHTTGPDVTIDNSEAKQEIKHYLPEPKPVSEEGRDIKEEPNDSIQRSDMVERKLREEEDQKTEGEEHRTGPDVTNDISEAKQEIKHDQTPQTPDLPGTLDASFHDDKEDSNKTEAKLEKTLSDVTANQLAVKTMDEEDNDVQNAQSAQIQTATPNNTVVATPQNTGIISSVGNVDPPSSLSLEFKLNIQFGQSKTPASPTSPSSPIERTEYVKSTEMSEVGIQAVEKILAVTQTTETQGAEIQKRTSLTEAAIQATQVTPESLQTAFIKDQPVLTDVGIQSAATEESEEQPTSPEEVQAAEISPTETLDVLLSQLAVSEGSVPLVKVVEQTEEECDQDVWMDAEEHIFAPDETEALQTEMEESVEYQSDYDQEPTAEFHTEEEDRHQDIHTTDGTAETESEGEEFTVAIEDPQNATTSTSTPERD